jgi:hypothetical protein
MLTPLFTRRGPGFLLIFGGYIMDNQLYALRTRLKQKSLENLGIVDSSDEMLDDEMDQWAWELESLGVDECDWEFEDAYRVYEGWGA